MAKYKILVIQHLLKGNQIAKSEEIVDGSKFINLQDSINGGYVKEFEESEDTDFDLALNKELKRIGKFSKEELIEFANENLIEFDESLNKKDLLLIVLASVSDNFQIEEEE